MKPSRERRLTPFRSGRRLLINARHGSALHPSEEGSLPSAPKISASKTEYMGLLSALASVDGLGTVPPGAVGTSASASGTATDVVIGNTNEPPPVYVVVGGLVGNEIEEAPSLLLHSRISLSYGVVWGLVLG